MRRKTSSDGVCSGIPIEFETERKRVGDEKDQHTSKLDRPQ